MKLKLEHNDQIEINFQSIWTTHDRLRTLDTDMVILVRVHKYFFLESWYIVKVFLVYVKCKKKHYDIVYTILLCTL